MDAMSIVKLILMIAGAGALVFLIWLFAEGALTVRKARTTITELKERVEPTLAHVEQITSTLEPAVARIDPLVERVQLTVDSVNLEIMQVDKILRDASSMTGTASDAVKKVSDVANAPQKMVNGAASKLRTAFHKKTAADRVERALEEAATEAPKQLDSGELFDKAASDIARDWAAEVSADAEAKVEKVDEAS
ncbi:MAG: hypothetical protein ACOYIP_00365 [Coriobacteriales bacterium]|jgi:uncharacterized protein YoxC